jgi:hypothetical protein
MILRDAIDHYVAWRRAHGARFITSARALYQFRKGVPEHVCCDAVTEREVRRFLDGTGPLPHRWRRKGRPAGSLSLCISRGYASGRHRRRQTKSRESRIWPPYIYSRKNCTLFEAVDISSKHAIRLDSDTFRTCPIRYGAGLRTSEALHLTMGMWTLRTSADCAKHQVLQESSRPQATPALLRAYANDARTVRCRKDGVRLCEPRWKQMRSIMSIMHLKGRSRPPESVAKMTVGAPRVCTCCATPQPCIG